jgi:hypothetical protein
MAEQRTLPKAPPARKQDTPGLRIGVFVAGLIVALVAGFALGKVIAPTSPTAGNGAMNNGGTSPMPGMNEASPHVHPNTSGAGSEVGGLAISASGYTLVPKQSAYSTGKQALSFVITGPDRKPVTEFATVHDKQLHLVVIRRDLTGYQHVHPTRAADGTWTVEVDLPKPGIWRAVADFTAIGAGGVQTAATLGTDLTVAGDYKPGTLPAAARESTVDGYTVTYEGTPQLGATSPLLFRVFKDGSPVTNLDRYLGSFGHLVVVRQLDVAYIHTHPEAELSGGAVKFWAVSPSTGTYRMFFDFQVSGVVHTASFTLNTSG